MKRHAIRITIGVGTFMVGVVVAAVWLSEPAPRLSLARSAPDELKPMSSPAAPAEPEIMAPPGVRADGDSTVYRVKLCDLVRDSKRYDGKIVRTQAFYNQGIDTASMDDSACDEWLRPSCAATDEACDKIWDRILKVYLSGRFSRVRVDVVGRYTADVVDPNPLQGGNHVHLFEIWELKTAKPAPNASR